MDPVNLGYDKLLIERDSLRSELLFLERQTGNLSRELFEAMEDLERCRLRLEVVHAAIERADVVEVVATDGGADPVTVIEP